jgi:hypothetical protein
VGFRRARVGFCDRAGGRPLERAGVGLLAAGAGSAAAAAGLPAAGLGLLTAGAGLTAAGAGSAALALAVALRAAARRGLERCGRVRGRFASTPWLSRGSLSLGALTPTSLLNAACPTRPPRACRISPMASTTR